MTILNLFLLELYVDVFMQSSNEMNNIHNFQKQEYCFVIWILERVSNTSFIWENI